MSMRSVAGRAVRKAQRMVNPPAPEPAAEDSDDVRFEEPKERIRNLHRTGGEPIMLVSPAHGMRLEFAGCEPGNATLSVRTLAKAAPAPQTVQLSFYNDVGTAVATGECELETSPPTDFANAEQGLKPLAFHEAFVWSGRCAVPEGATTVHVDGLATEDREHLITFQSARIENSARMIGPRFATSAFLRLRSESPNRLLIKLPGKRGEQPYWQLVVPSVVGTSAALARTKAFQNDGTPVEPGRENAIDRQGRILHAIARGRSVSRPGRATKTFGIPDETSYFDVDLGLFLDESIAYFDLRRVQGRTGEPRRRHDEMSGIGDRMIARELSEAAHAESTDDFLRLFN